MITTYRDNIFNFFGTIYIIRQCIHINYSIIKNIQLTDLQSLERRSIMKKCKLLGMIKKVGICTTVVSTLMNTSIPVVANTFNNFEDSILMQSFTDFAKIAFQNDNVTISELSLSSDYDVLTGVDGEEYFCYDVNLLDQPFGYVVFSSEKNAPPYEIMEFGYGENPTNSVSTYSINTPAFLYAGPLDMYITEETQLYLDDTEATAFSLYSGESIDLSQLQIDVHPDNKIEIPNTYGTPPTSGYRVIRNYNHRVFSTDIQNSLGMIPSMYGCGPAAGTCLLYSLADLNSQYSNMLKWKSDPNRPMTMSDMGSILITDMSAIAGTTFNEFQQGLSRYLNNYGHYPSINAEMRSDINSLGTPTTTSNLVVWNNLKTGINSTKPVAVLAGNKLSSGSNVYPDTGSTSSMKFHWFTALGYIEDTTSSNNGLYLRVSSWGKTYYVSYSALCYWRDTLASVYIGATY